jgi:hypothetical protein
MNPSLLIFAGFSLFAASAFAQTPRSPEVAGVANVSEAARVTVCRDIQGQYSATDVQFCAEESIIQRLILKKPRPGIELIFFEGKINADQDLAMYCTLTYAQSGKSWAVSKVDCN